jgi:hypothetical protein
MIVDTIMTFLRCRIQISLSSGTRSFCSLNLDCSDFSVALGKRGLYAIVLGRLRVMSSVYSLAFRHTIKKGPHLVQTRGDKSAHQQSEERVKYQLTGKPKHGHYYPGHQTPDGKSC